MADSAYQLGRLYRARYAGLVDDDPEKAIYVRSRGNHRCIESAGYLLEVSLRFPKSRKSRVCWSTNRDRMF